MKHLIKSLLFVLIFTCSCTPKAAEESYATEVTELSMLSKKKETSPGLDKAITKEVVKKKIIKDGSLGIEVKDLAQAKTQIDTLLRSVGGYYDSEDFSNNDYAIQYDFKIRIPAEKFELFIAKLEQEGNNVVSYKNIEARDVTEEFIDLETRLTNKQKYLARYQDLLKNAKSVKEILEIQEKIRGLEEELESTAGRLKYMNDLLNYSTLSLNVSQKKDYKYTPEQRANIVEKVKQSVVGGWYSFVDFLLILLYNWAFLIIIAVAVYYFVKYRKHRKKNKQKA